MHKEDENLFLINFLRKTFYGLFVERHRTVE